MALTHLEAQEIAKQLGRIGQDRGMRTLPRVRRVAPNYGGGCTIEQIAICRCCIDPEPFAVDGRGKNCRRGPAGGVCGNCGGAIPE